METYIAILRGINVGGRNKVSMEQLRQVFTSCQAANVSTYIASGNVIFQVNKNTDIQKFRRQVLATFENSLGFSTPLQIRSLACWSNAIRDLPFAQEEIGDLHLSFCDKSIEKAIDSTVQKEQSNEMIVMDDRVYIKTPNGYSKTKFQNHYIEKIGNCEATTRNWKTVLKLEAIANAI